MDSVFPSTPPRKHTAASHDTPAVVKAAYTADPDLCTDGNRKVMLKDLQEQVPQVALEVFFEKGLLPDLRDDIKLDEVLEKLRQATPRVLFANNKWNHFNRPSDFEKKENSVYSNLVNTIDGIATASGISASERTLRFQCNPDDTPISTMRDNKSKPDCVGLLADTPEGRIEWVDIGVPAEFKTHNTTVEKNDVRNSHFFWEPEFMATNDTRTGSSCCGRLVTSCGKILGVGPSSGSRLKAPG